MDTRFMLEFSTIFLLKKYQESPHEILKIAWLSYRTCSEFYKIKNITSANITDI